MGTEAFWVPAVLAAVSAGGQYANQSAANSRSDKAEAQALTDQQQIREKGEQDVNKTVQDISKSNPQSLAATATGDYVSQLRRNQAGSTTNAPTPGSSALAPAVGGSARYNSDKGTSQQSVQSYGNTNASELGDLDAAVRQRQNEGLEMQTLGTNLNTLGAQSYSQNFVDQLRANTAGQTNPWVSLFSTLVGNAGTAASKNPQWFSTGGVNAAAPGVNAGNPWDWMQK
jgi:hypothetical protein